MWSPCSWEVFLPREISLCSRHRTVCSLLISQVLLLIRNILCVLLRNTTKTTAKGLPCQKSVINYPRDGLKRLCLRQSFLRIDCLSLRETKPNIGFDILWPFDEGISDSQFTSWPFAPLEILKVASLDHWIGFFHLSLSAFGAIVTFLCFVFPPVDCPIALASWHEKEVSHFCIRQCSVQLHPFWTLWDGYNSVFSQHGDWV